MTEGGDRGVKIGLHGGQGSPETGFFEELGEH